MTTMNMIPSKSSDNSKIYLCKIENGPVIGNNIKLASKWSSRLKGLLGTKTLGDNDGLLLVPCQSIHMFFMSIPLDVIFLDEQGVVVGVYHSIKPWRISRYFGESYGTLEIKAGRAKAMDIKEGDLIKFTFKNNK